MKDEIIQFLKENIIGKTLLTGAVYKLENGNLEGWLSTLFDASDALYYQQEGES